MKRIFIWCINWHLWPALWFWVTNLKMNIFIIYFIDRKLYSIIYSADMFVIKCKSSLDTEVRQMHHWTLNSSIFYWNVGGTACAKWMNVYLFSYCTTLRTNKQIQIIHILVPLLYWHHNSQTNKYCSLLQATNKKTIIRAY